MVKAVYYPVGGNSGTTGGGTIQTIVRVGVLRTFNVARQTTLMLADFSEAIPNSYELYYNGLWYNQGQLEEYRYALMTLCFPNLVWAASDVMELKYQIII